MPTIEPVPMAELSAEARTIIEDGSRDGLYATPVPLQIFAYSTRPLCRLHETRLVRGTGSLLGGAHPRAAPHPLRAARRVPAVHAVAQARLDHRRGRRVPARRRR